MTHLTILMRDNITIKLEFLPKMFLIDNLQEPIMGVEMEVNISGPDKNQVLPLIKKDIIFIHVISEGHGHW